MIEEGFPTADLRRIAVSMARAAERAGVSVAAGDTKVVERGKADGLYITTAGVGVVAPGVELGRARVRPGDRVLVSGPIGDHGMAVMVARGELQLEVDLESDTALRARARTGAADARRRRSLHARPDPGRRRDDAERARAGLGHRRPPRRGGSCRCGRRSSARRRSSASIRSTSPARAGSSPSSRPRRATQALALLRSHPLGAEAAIIGEVRAEPAGARAARDGLRRQPRRRHARGRSPPAHLLTRR